MCSLILSVASPQGDVGWNADWLVYQELCLQAQLTQYNACITDNAAPSCLLHKCILRDQLLIIMGQLSGDVNDDKVPSAFHIH